MENTNKGVREQALSFQSKLISENYNRKAYQLAGNNTKYNSEGVAVISKDDEWTSETEWDEMFEQQKKLIRAWDSDFTQLTPSEAEELKQIIKDVGNGDYVSEDKIDWD